MTMTECTRIITCEHCGGEGRLLRGHPNDPHPTDCGPCKACDGTGREVIETEPVEMDDLSPTVQRVMKRFESALARRQYYGPPSKH